MFRITMTIWDILCVIVILSVIGLQIYTGIRREHIEKRKQEEKSKKEGK